MIGDLHKKKRNYTSTREKKNELFYNMGVNNAFPTKTQNPIRVK